MKALTATNFFFRNQTTFLRGKVRDVYSIGQEHLVVVACDRISAFDHVLPKPIPYKGQVLNSVAALFLDATRDIIPNWKISTPDPQVTIGYKCDAIPVEFVVRGYLAGHAWRIYREGGRTICGVKMPDGLRENDQLPHPIITPSTKASSGHDEDISLEEIIERKLLTQKQLDKLVETSLALYARGTEYAAERGLILVDTKYEFGRREGKLMLIDEVHTPDSSRFFYANAYDELQKQGKPQKQLSKEFVREWLIAHHFQGQKGQVIPDMPDEFIASITDRYVELYTAMTGQEFVKRSYQNILSDMEQRIISNLEQLNII
ncbi:MAG: phosphoribosylaminoimidazolesuccinocarboxamide synthase [Bacteroidetes bacterium]|nr:phosphoribosylaminoimidazolesuccinocarboxamide synthase [Bacteroidota bacterium]